ncbi:MAG: hypothetical protein ACR2J4_01710, partial [Deinococcus sp.]
ARLAAVLKGILSSGRVTHSAIARTLPGSASPASKIKRVARTFHHTSLDVTLVTSPMVSHLGDDPLTLVLDRTNWSLGKDHQNLPVLGAWFHGYTIPLVWEPLPHDGSSDTQLRIALVKRLLTFIPATRINVLIADREFIGAAWFAFLRSAAHQAVHPYSGRYSPGRSPRPRRKFTTLAERQPQAARTGQTL